MTRHDGQIGTAGDPSNRADGNHRLVGWKAIAASLGKDERTAKRWALELGLPVHRVPGRQRASVYAFPQELETWLRRDREAAAPAKPAPPSATQKPYKNVRAAAAAALLLVLGGLAAVAMQNWMLVPEQGPASTAPILPQDVVRLRQDATYLWQKRTPDTLKQAETLLLQIATIAPRFAGARSDLAIVYDLMVEYGVLSADDGYGLARDAAEQALQIDPADAQAHAVLGDITFFQDRDYPAGLSHLTAAVQLDEHLGTPRHWYAAALMAMGRFDEAAVEIAKARQIEPTSRSMQVSAAMIALGAENPEEARRSLLQLIANEPDYRSPYRFLAFAELALGNERAYLAAWRERFRLTRDDAGAAIVEAGSRALAFGGSSAPAMLDAAQQHQSSIEPYFMAHLLALAGQWREAAAQLGKTPTRHAFYYGIDPAFAQARASPQFLGEIAKLGLPVVP